MNRSMFLDGHEAAMHDLAEHKDTCRKAGPCEVCDLLREVVYETKALADDYTDHNPNAWLDAREEF